MNNATYFNNFYYDRAKQDRAIWVSETAYKTVHFISENISYIVAKLDNFIVKRETKRQLMSLSDVQLSDIGLTRAEIEFMLS